MSITALLIDDEPKAISILEDKLKRHCPQVQVVGSSQNPTEAIELIKNLTPQLIFLDISMPGMTGFELLKKFEKPDFEIIFATAYDQYAIEAIKHCAIGYLVKPIDNDDLVAAVHAASENIIEKSALAKNRQLIENLGVQKFQKKKIIIPATSGLEFVSIDTITHCEGVDGYTKIHFSDRKPILSSSSIGHFIKLLNHADFYQVHKSFLINLNHLERYLNEGYVVVTGDHTIPVSRSKRTDFLQHLKP
ncbi:MAG: LytTR family DNA-binding domain-containing protein [Nonlabens sp.]|nr:LytTR family DNA-binding domain-containing protein [Nonlabens sp.]